MSVLTNGVYDFLFSHLQPESGEPKLELKAVVLNNYVIEFDSPQSYIDNLFYEIEKYSPKQANSTDAKNRAAD